MIYLLRYKTQSPIRVLGYIYNYLSTKLIKAKKVLFIFINLLTILLTIH